MKRTLSILLALVMFLASIVPVIGAVGDEAYGPTPGSRKRFETLIVRYHKGENIPTYYDYLSKEWSGTLYLKTVTHTDAEVKAIYSGWVYYIMDKRSAVEIKREGKRGVLIVHDSPLSPKMYNQNLFIDTTK